MGYLEVERGKEKMGKVLKFKMVEAREPTAPSNARTVEEKRLEAVRKSHWVQGGSQGR
jgi:hypothetical protein